MRAGLPAIKQDMALWELLVAWSWDQSQKTYLRRTRNMDTMASIKESGGDTGLYMTEVTYSFD